MSQRTKINVEAQKVDVSAAGEINEEQDSSLEEYKLANQIHQSYYDLGSKTVTIYLTITALSLGFVFREAISDQLRIILCWFNVWSSLVFTLGFTGFYIVTKRLARRMDYLSKRLKFALPHHNGLSYGIMLSLLTGSSGLIFWIAVLFFKFWAK
jgi:hypothetical protein